MTKKPVHSRGRGMAFDMDLAVSDHAVSDRAALLDRLDDALCAASELNLSLLSKIVAGACTRIPILAGAQKNSPEHRRIGPYVWPKSAHGPMRHSP
jgi:hypothetical protein